MTGFETERQPVQEQRNALGPFLQSLYLSVLAGAVGYAVFEHGARGLFDWNISLLIIGVVALGYWGFTSFSDAAPPMERPLRLLTLLVPAYIVFQLFPLPIFLVKILSPERGRILDSLRAVMPLDAFAPLSIAPATTFAHLFRIIGYLLVFVLVREVAARSRPWVVVIPLIGIAGLEAALGLVQNSDGALAQGTYPNRNHFAGLLEMVLPIAIACAIALLRSRPSHGGLTARYALGGGAVLSLATLMLVAVVYSSSKMGYVACMGGIFSLAAVASVATLQGGKKWWMVALLGGFFLLVSVFLPPEQLRSGFESAFSDQTAEGRLPTWRDSLHLLSAYPVAGSGFGTYDTAFVKYQTALLDADFDFAHNDYLELATELGAVGFLILAGFVLTLVAKTLRAGTKDFDQNTRYLAWGCVGAIAAIGLHSLTDFNLYIPANALVLAWIFGIAASFPSRQTTDGAQPGGLRFKGAGIALSCLLLIYAPAWILLEGKFQDDPQAEKRFCRFGVCDTDAMIASETAKHGGNVADVPTVALFEALRRDSAAPLRWCDLGDALLKSGRVEQAGSCFSNALRLGPNIPPVQFRAANFYSSTQDRERELEQAASILKESALYDSQIFYRYGEEKIPVAEVLSKGLPKDQRAAQSYLHYLMQLKNVADAMTVWDWVLSEHFGDDRLVREYMDFLLRDHRYESAAQAWARYLGNRRNGYMESNWLYNGDFESEPSGVAFDWRIESLNDDVVVTLDSSVAHTGLRSLKIQFGGKENVNYSHTSQTAFVRPGRYRFTAFVRTAGITTDQGIAFHIFDPEPGSHLDVKTEQFTGTADWKEIEQIITVPAGRHLLTVQLIRPASWKFDSKIAGTAWIDTVSLSRVE